MMKEVALKDICNKDSSALKQKELLPKGKYPVYGASGIAGYLDSYHQEDSYIGIVKDGSGIGRVDFYPEKTSLIGTMQYILPKKGYNIRYIGYCLQSLDLSKYKQGAAIPHIYFRDYGERLVKVTDNEAEQRSIVSRLDAAFAGIDALIFNAERQLAEARALFNRALTEEMTPKEGWKEGCLGNFLNFRRGFDLTHAEMKEGNVPVAGSNGIIGYHNVATNISPCITIGRSGSVGKLNIYDRCWAHNTTLFIDDFKGNDPYFLAYLVQSLGVGSYSGGSAVPTLNRNFIHPIKTSIPNKNAQHSIVTRLDALTANVRKLEEVQRKTLVECNKLKQAMLKEVFE